MVVNATDSSFDKDVIEASHKMPVIVDFWASWCGPCRVLGPIIERIGEEYKGKVKVVKLNVEDNLKQPQKYDIVSIPAVMMFKSGKVVDEFVGAIPEIQVRHWVGKNLK